MAEGWSEGASCQRNKWVRISILQGEFWKGWKKILTPDYPRKGFGAWNLELLSYYLFLFRLLFRRCRINPPSLMSSCMNAGIGFARNFFFCVRSKISPEVRFTRTRSPFLISFEASEDSKRGRPRLSPFR